MKRENYFLDLSRLLTGVNKLDPELAKPYYHYLEQKFDRYLDELLGIYQELVQESKESKNVILTQLVGRIKNDAQLIHVTKQIVRIWYVSQINESFDPANKKESYAGYWKKGVLWDIIKAHPPALTNHPD